MSLDIDAFVAATEHRHAYAVAQQESLDRMLDVLPILAELNVIPTFSDTYWTWQWRWPWVRMQRRTWYKVGLWWWVSSDGRFRTSLRDVVVPTEAEFKDVLYDVQQHMSEATSRRPRTLQDFASAAQRFLQGQ